MSYDDIILNFTSIIYEALPFVVLGVVIAGILEEFVPQQLLAGIFQGGVWSEEKHARLPGIVRFLLAVVRFRFFAIALGGLLGLIFPMCECGIIAIMRRLIRKGVPLSVCVCYTLAGPIINVVVMLSTYVAFNFPRPEDYLFDGPVDTIFRGPLNVVLIRVGMGFVVAMIASIVVDWQYEKYGKSLLHPSLVIPDNLSQEGQTNGKPSVPLTKRLGNIAETALHDFIDIMAFLVIGAALAAVGRASIDGSEMQSWVQNQPEFAILMMMGLAVLFCLCSEADAFVAANFALALPPAAKIAFLVLGPMMDIKLFMMYTRLYRQRLIWIIFLVVAAQVFLYSLGLHYLWPNHGYPESYLTINPPNSSP